jgi:hypothetical protein
MVLGMSLSSRNILIPSTGRMKALPPAQNRRRGRAMSTSPVVAGVVVGMRCAEEARRNAESVRAEIPAQVWADLRGEGLLDQRAPVDT